MSDPDPLKERLQQIAAIKQQYWTTKGIGEEYHYHALAASPITRAKNVTEIGFVQRNALGPRVLDAGAGTGRFTFPLRQAGYEPIALDISREMLNEGVKLARRTRLPFPCVIGDIGRLPFPDDAFDSVVSVTVLRHFPQWAELLREYIRIVRPHGRILFDMASGDQRAYLREETGVTSTVQEDEPFDPLDYDAAVTMKELLALANEIKCTVLTVSPYDLFNLNGLLDHILGEAKANVERVVAELLDTEGGLVLHELITRRFLAALSPAVTSSWFIVLEKGTHKKYTPAYRRLEASGLGGHEANTLVAILKSCLGAQFQTYLPELAHVLKDPDAEKLMAVCWQEILPRLPLETLYWEAG